jgi:hypothetical protein
MLTGPAAPPDRLEMSSIAAGATSQSAVVSISSGREPARRPGQQV